MARVPLPAEAIPLPDVKVSGRVYPERLRVEATPDMFGAQIGRSLEYTGQQLSKEVGDQIFNEAVKIQENKNASTSIQTMMAARQKMDQDNDEFFTKKQLDAHNGLIPALQKNQDTYNQFANSITSPDARRMFERDMAPYMRNDDISMRRHASDEFNKYNLATINSQQQLNIKDIPKYIDKPEIIKGIYEKNEELERDKAKLLGYPTAGPEASYNIASTTSSGKLQEILGLKDRPFEQQDRLDHAEAHADLIGKDLTEARDRVRINVLTRGAKQIAASRVEGMRWAEGEVPLDWARNAIFYTESTQNQYSGQKLLEMDRRGELRKIKDKNGNVVWPHGAPLGYGQVMTDFLPDFLKRAGLDPKITPEQFLADADMQRKVFDANFGPIMKQYHSFNAAARWWFTGNVNPPAWKHDNLGTTPSKYEARADMFLGAWARNLASQRSENEDIRGGLEDTRAHTGGRPDPELEEAVTSAIVSRHRQINQVRADDNADAWRQVGNALFNDRNSGVVPTSYNELIDRHRELEPIIRTQMDGLNQNKLMNILDSLARGEQNLMTNDAWKRYFTLRGMALDPNRTEQDVQTFMHTNILDEKLPWTKKEELFNLQYKVGNGMEAAPHLSQALSILAPDLQDTSINMNKQNPDWDVFIGVLEQRLEDYSKTYGKAAPPDYIKEQGKALLRGLADESIFASMFGIGKKAFIHTDIPDEDRQHIEEAIRSGGGTPTEDLIRKYYLWGQLSKPKAFQQQEKQMEPTQPGGGYSFMPVTPPLSQ